jgi:hypothetical protein
MRARLALLAIALTLPLLSGSCSTGSAAPLADAPSLPALPQDGPAWTRQVSEVTTIDGVDTYLDCGAPGAAPHISQATWLTLDGDQAAGEYAWAIWQIPLSDLTTVQEIALSIQQSGLSKYYLAWADYSAGQWRFISVDGKAELQGQKTLTVPGAQIGDETAMHSPGEFAYLAMLVLPGHKINVAGYTVTVDIDNSGNDPIYDDFEDNDNLDTCYPLEPGEYRASIHQKNVPEMDDPNENRDAADAYCIDVGPGQTLTVTLRHELYDHFGGGWLNDLDLCFYSPGSDDVWEDLVESESSISSRHPFEQIVYESGGGTYYISVLPDLVDMDTDDDAEYYINVFLSDNTYRVSGTVKLDGQTVTKDYTVYLEPGNFNALTPVDGGENGFGSFNIEGVPNGEYTLKVQGTNTFGEQDIAFPVEMPVTVLNNDEVNLVVELSP